MAKVVCSQSEQEQVYKAFMNLLAHPSGVATKTFFDAVDRAGGLSPSNISTVKAEPKLQNLSKPISEFKKSFEVWDKQFLDEKTLPEAKLDWHFAEDYKKIFNILVKLDELLLASKGSEESVKNFFSQRTDSDAQLILGFRNLLRGMYTFYGGYGSVNSKYAFKMNLTSLDYNHGYLYKQFEAVLKHFESHAPGPI